LYCGINTFKKGYQPRINIVNNGKGDFFFTDFHFSQLLNEHEIFDVRQTEVHKAEPLVPETGAFEV
jgi:hypothetical protein